MNEVSIEVNGLGKRYRIGVAEPEPDSLPKALLHLLGAPFNYLRSTLSKPSESEILWALRDVSFSVRRGEVLGVIGGNGAGKSTLLKLLSRVTSPTEGRFSLRGRVGSLLEVGTGFHPDLTGRENVYLNGAILGMTQAEVRGKFDEIVAFAGLDRFIDTPVKRYSSGMYVRLGFAVAAHLEPEIMILDEVLAVGDAAFQARCAERMQSAAHSGATILLVSHRNSTISGLCERAIWMDKGRVRLEGECLTVLDGYLESVREQASLTAEEAGVRARLRTIRMHSGDGVSTSFFQPGKDLHLEAELSIRDEVRRPYLWFTIIGASGPMFGASMYMDDFRPEVLSGEQTIRCVFPAPPFVPGHSYSVRFGLNEQDAVTQLIAPGEVAHFNVTGDASDVGFEAETAGQFLPKFPPLLLPYRWELPGGRIGEFGRLGPTAPRKPR
jgi:lipopolysaccharide transport system ATP-binding protein